MGSELDSEDRVLERLCPTFTIILLSLASQLILERLLEMLKFAKLFATHWLRVGECSHSFIFKSFMCGTRLEEKEAYRNLWL